MTVTIPELIASPLLWLDVLATDFLATTGMDACAKSLLLLEKLSWVLEQRLCS